NFGIGPLGDSPQRGRLGRGARSMRQPDPVPARRFWPVTVAIGCLAALAILWTGLWFYAANKSEATIAGWRERESRVGRTYTCATQRIGGFPFRIEVSCADLAVKLDREVPPLALEASGLVVLAQVFEPTWLVADLKGPLTVAERDHPPAYIANWTKGQASARGTPLAPERISIAVEQPIVDRVVE